MQVSGDVYIDSGGGMHNTSISASFAHRFDKPVLDLILVYYKRRHIHNRHVPQNKVKERQAAGSTRLISCVIPLTLSNTIIVATINKHSILNAAFVVMCVVVVYHINIIVLNYVQIPIAFVLFKYQMLSGPGVF